MEQDASVDAKVNTSLTDGPIVSRLVAFSLPVVGANLLQSVGGTINQYWVSRSLGTDAVTAIGNSNIVLLLLTGAIFGAAMAANILISQHMGAGDLAGLRRTMGTCVAFFAILAVLVASAGYTFTADILSVLGTPVPAVAPATTYLRWIFVALPVLYFFTFLQMAQRGTGDSRSSFVSMGFAVAINAVLAPLLIGGWGAVPALGIAGAALATFAGQIAGLALLVSWMYVAGSPLALGRRDLVLLKPDGATLRILAGRGLPMGLQMLVMSGSAVAMIGLVNGYGSVTAAAFAAATQIWAYVQLPAMSIGATVSSMAAQNIGAGRMDRVDRIAATGIACSLVATIIPAALLYASDVHALRLFLPSGSPALPVALHLSQIVLWSFILFSVTFALQGVVRSTGAVWQPLGILFIALVLVRLPFALLLMPRFGSESIWWSFPIGILVSCVLTILYYRKGDWRRMRQDREAHQIGLAVDGGAACPSVSSASGTHMMAART